MTPAPRRPHGSGSLFVKTNARGDEVFYAQWRIDGRLVKRRIGPKRKPRSDQGLTRVQAEAELRRLITSTTVIPEVMDIAHVGRRWLEHLHAVGRKRSTLMDYE